MEELKRCHLLQLAAQASSKGHRTQTCWHARAAAAKQSPGPPVQASVVLVTGTCHQMRHIKHSQLPTIPFPTDLLPTVHRLGTACPRHTKCFREYKCTETFALTALCSPHHRQSFGSNDSHPGGQGWTFDWWHAKGLFSLRNTSW